MKVVHGLGWYFPESGGGTEVYVHALTRHLRTFGVDSSIVAATSAPIASEYDWDGTSIFRYPVPEATREEIAERRPHDEFEIFTEWLRKQDADVYHQHSWTRGCGPAHLKFAQELGLKTVVTIHEAGALCLRGTMMLHGAEPCDGAIDVERCTSCWGESRGIPALVGDWQSRSPEVSARISHLLPHGRLKTMFATPEIVARRQTELGEVAQASDRIVAVCRWLHEALRRNGVPDAKLAFCPQAIEIGTSARRERSQRDTLRVGFLGRWSPIKGIHILVDAFARLPQQVRAELVVHGLPGDTAYEQKVRERAASDPRIRIAAPVERDQILTTVANFDLLAVPSLVLETGPLVVLEAFAAGTPVLGSRLGGIEELLNGAGPAKAGPYDRPHDSKAGPYDRPHDSKAGPYDFPEAGPHDRQERDSWTDHPETGGRLVAAGDVDAWSRAIEDIATSDWAWTRHVPLPPSTTQLAQQMAAIYEQLPARLGSAATPLPRQHVQLALGHVQ